MRLSLSRTGSRGLRDETRQRIRAVVDTIPRGRVATYGQVAREAGLPRRARWVGRVLSELPTGTKLPWYRVLGAGGRITLPIASHGLRQRRLLRAEGVEVTNTGRVDMARFGWAGD